MTAADAQERLRTVHGWTQRKINEAKEWRSRPSGLSRLHEAALAGRFDEAKCLLVLGCDPAALTTVERQTPLHKAALAGEKGRGDEGWDICELLVKKGAPLEAKDSMSSTATEYALRKGHTTVAKKLAKLRANKDGLAVAA